MCVRVCACVCVSLSLPVSLARTRSLSHARAHTHQGLFLTAALERAPASSHWLTPLAACPDVLHVSLLAHAPRAAHGTGLGGGRGTVSGPGGEDVMLLTCAGQGTEMADLAGAVHSAMTTQARGRGGHRRGEAQRSTGRVAQVRSGGGGGRDVGGGRLWISTGGAAWG